MIRATSGDVGMAMDSRDALDATYIVSVNRDAYEMSDEEYHDILRDAAKKAGDHIESVLRFKRWKKQKSQ